MSSRLVSLTVALVLVALFLVELSVARSTSVTCDECCFLGNGLGYVKHGRVILNPEHPPLAKLIAGVSLAAFGVEERSAGELIAQVSTNGGPLPKAPLPSADEYARRILEDDNPGFRFWDARPGVDSITLAGRLPALVFTPLVALVAFLWARARFGVGAGFLALALVATDPDLLGHGALATTDLPVTAFGFLAGFALDRVIAKGGLAWLVAFGLACGGALASKYSTPFLLPAFALAALVALARPEDEAAAGATHPLGRGSLARRSALFAATTVISALLATLVLAVAYMGHEPIGSYIAGTNAMHTHIPTAFRGNCLGRFEHRFWYYPFVVFTLKAPVGTIALVLLLVFLSAKRKTPRASLAGEAAIHAPPAFLLAALVAFAAPAGSRYLLPIVPFLFVSVSRLWCWADRSRVKQAVLTLAIVSNIAGVIHDHPYHEASTNLIAGDPKFVFNKIDNSNQDWGHGLKALRLWQEKTGTRRLVVAGTDAKMLEAYGIEGVSAPYNVDALFHPQPGVVFAISTHLASQAILVERQNARDALVTGKAPPPRVLGGKQAPDEIVGGAFLIFHVPD